MYKTKTTDMKINAFQWDGTENTASFPDWAKSAIQKKVLEFHGGHFNKWIKLKINRDDGTITAVKGDFIILYPSGTIGHLNADDFNYNFQSA